MKETNMYQQYIGELTVDERKALTLLSDLFVEEGSWPSERAFRFKLKSILGKENYQDVIEKLSPHFFFSPNSGSHNAVYQLSLGGMCAVDEAAFHLVCRYFDYIKDEYKKNPDVKRITSEEVQVGLNLTDNELLNLRMCAEFPLWVPGDFLKGDRPESLLAS